MDAVQRFWLAKIDKKRRLLLKLKLGSQEQKDSTESLKKLIAEYQQFYGDGRDTL